MDAKKKPHRNNSRKAVLIAKKKFCEWFFLLLLHLQWFVRVFAIIFSLYFDLGLWLHRFQFVSIDFFFNIRKTKQKNREKSIEKMTNQFTIDWLKRKLKMTNCGFSSSYFLHVNLNDFFSVLDELSRIDAIPVQHIKLNCSFSTMLGN